MNSRRILYGFFRLFLCALLTLCFSACRDAGTGIPSTQDTEQSVSYSSADQADHSDASDLSSNQPPASDGAEATESEEESSRTDTSDTATSQTSTDTATSTTQSSSTKTSSTSTQTSTKTSSQKPNTSDTVNNPTEPEDLPEPPVYTNISPVQPEDYYGLRWLSTQSNGQKMVTAYRELVSGIGKREDTISISSGITKDQLKTVWSCVTADYPQYFWLSTAYRYSYQENTVLDVSPEYTVTKAALPAAQTKFNNAVKGLLSGITSSMTQYEIEKTLHDRLILHCQYANASDCHNSYGALVNKTAVCEGIAKAFQHLCRSVGIDTLLISGKSADPSSGTEVGHAWNIVKIDGNYYHIDVTWDNAGEPTQDEIHYAWFNVPTEWIGQDHTLTQRGYSYPNCTATKHNYFTKNNLVLTDLTVADVVRRTVKKQDSFRFQGYLRNDTDVVRWLNENAAALAREYGLNGYSYTLSSVGKEICIVMSKYQ